LHAAFDHTQLTKLGAKHATLLAVAMLNRIFQEVAQSAILQTHVGAGIDINHIIKTPIHGGGQVLNADSRLESAIEAVSSWLWDTAKSADRQGGDEPISLMTLTSDALHLYSLQRGIHQIWQQALWEGWRLKSNTKPKRWEPADKKLANLFAGWLARQDTHFTDVGWRDSGLWANMSTEQRRAFQLERTVVRVERQERPGSRFQIEQPPTSGNIAPLYVLDRAGLQASYLREFLDTPLPRARVCTSRLLLRAWHVLRDLADIASATLQTPSFQDMEHIQAWALTFERQEVVEVLIEALQLSESDAAEVLRFLTWKPDTYKGLWGAPIVPVPGTDRVCIARTVLSASEGIRRTEIWLYKGGLTTVSETLQQKASHTSSS
jgi:hypothetical protein